MYGSDTFYVRLGYDSYGRLDYGSSIGNFRQWLLNINTETNTVSLSGLTYSDNFKSDPNNRIVNTVTTELNGVPNTEYLINSVNFSCVEF